MEFKRALLASSALALFAGAQEAQAGDLYLSVFGGANWVTNSSASLQQGVIATSGTLWEWQTDADTGFVLGGAIGTSLDKWQKGLRVELETSYRRNDVPGGWRVIEGGEGGGTSSGAIDANLSTFAVMANLWYEHDMGWKVRPYIGGGVGWARAKLDGAVLTSSGSSTFTSFDIENNGFAWQLGAGFNYEAAPGVDLGLGYRYFNGPDFSRPFGIDSFFTGKATFGRLDNDNHSVMVNLTIDID